ncbi:hypothetical protein AMJ52_06060, partial [candidate division TA06 bacterium DG_78]
KETLKRLTTVLRIVVGIGLIVFLLWRLDINQLLTKISGINVLYLSYGLIPYFLFVIVSAWRWQVLLDYKKFQIPFPRTTVIYFIALFFNNLLPTTIGGDGIRVLYSMGKRKADSLAVVLTDRILGFIGLFIFALIAVLYLWIEKRQTEFLLYMSVGLVILIIVAYILFSERAYKRISPVVRKIKIFKLGERLSRLHDSFTDFGRAWGPITLCTVHSIIIQVLLAVGPFLVLRALGNYEVGILPFFIYLPIINVVSMIPISLNGIGVRESFFVLLFSRVGLSGETALAVSIISFLLIFLWSILGGIFFIVYKKK